MKRIFGFIVVSAAVLLPLAAGFERAGQAAPGKQAAATLDTALLDEMHALDAAFRKIVSSVALGDSDEVARIINTMHVSRERTEEALDAGKITLPRNRDKSALFRKKDAEFHADMRMLEKTAVKGDRESMIKITQRLLGRCADCHATFRK